MLGVHASAERRAAIPRPSASCRCGPPYAHPSAELERARREHIARQQGRATRSDAEPTTAATTPRSDAKTDGESDATKARNAWLQREQNRHLS